METFYIEKTKAKDTVRLSKLECACYGYRWHPYANWTWKAISGYGYAFTAKTRKGDRIVGGIGAIMTNKGKLYLDSVFVSPAWRGRGIAKLLLKRVAGIAKRKRLRLEGHVDGTNAPMIKLLGALRFSRGKKAKNYYDEKPERMYFVYRR